MTDESQTTSTPRRGRPRPQETIDRDEAVFAAINGEVSKQAIAELTKLPPSQVYLSLYRLQRDNRIQRRRSDSGHVWVRTV